MTKLLTYLNHVTINESTSPIQYERAGYRQRYLTLNGEELANTGIDCETCMFYVEVSETKMADPTHLSGLLNRGLRELNNDLLANCSCIIPNGQYVVGLLNVYPRLKRWRDGNEYYQIGSRQISISKKIEEYIVPFQPSASLDQAAVRAYKNRMENKGNQAPTALCVSFVDMKYPLDHLDFDEVWLHTHYILDGHHKMLAAAQAKKPITLLSFLSIEESFADREQIDALIQALL